MKKKKCKRCRKNKKLDKFMTPQALICEECQILNIQKFLQE